MELSVQFFVNRVLLKRNSNAMNKQEIYHCQNCQAPFTIDASDFAFYEKIKVPSPTWCPECRMMRRFIFFNERLLFRRKDDSSGKEIISGIPQEAPLKVYELGYWWSDHWDAMNYGRDYDFSRPFFEQAKELFCDVPHPAKDVTRMINSDYCNNSSDLKNSYLCFSAGPGENSAYSVRAEEHKECFDIYEARHDELCFEGLLVDDSYRTFFSMDVENCTDVWFSRDLVGCSYCFCCVGLRNKSYYIFNEPYTKEQYAEKIKGFNLGAYSSVNEFYEQSRNFWLKFPVKYMHGWQNIRSSGEHIQNSKEVVNSYFIHEGENLRNAQLSFGDASDASDVTCFGLRASLLYESSMVGLGAYNIKFSINCWPDVSDIEYSIQCHSSSNLFGCVGLRNKQHCIFNKQYSKEDYFSLREKIIRHMEEMPYVDAKGRTYVYGEFFPLEFSPFAYNETIASDFFPLTKEAVESQGYLWRDAKAYEYETTINAKDLPDHINAVDDSILKEIIKCVLCGRAYRIIQMELDFYRRIGLPLPRLCSDCRYIRRVRLANIPKFWHRRCHCAGSTSSPHAGTGYAYQNAAPHFHGSDPCPSEFETSYAPDRQEIVYCEQCYQIEVV